MDNLHWQLSVLSKAIHYKNLSGAASHVGLSQPQLSRIVSKLEQELSVVLLDRTARRKSGWTPIAFKIADTYFRNSRKLTQSLQQLKTDDQVTQVSIGLLEGLIPIVNEFCHEIFEQSKMQLIEINVFDLSELEERFEKDELDLIFTCREPGRHKYRHIHTLGYQSLRLTNATDAEASGGGGASVPQVFSQFEYATHLNQTSKAPKRPSSRVVLSNSLLVRKHWIDEIGGMGWVPSEVRKKKTKESDVPVVLIGSDLLHPAVWQRFEQFRP